MHSADDPFVPSAQSRQMYYALKNAGAEVSLTILQTVDHDLYSKKRLLQCLDFFDKQI